MSLWYRVFHFNHSMQLSLKVFAIVKNVSNNFILRGISYYGHEFFLDGRIFGIYVFLNESSANMMLFIHSRDTIPFALQLYFTLYFHFTYILFLIYIPYI